MEQKSKLTEYAAPLGLVPLAHPSGGHLITIDYFNNSFKGYSYVLTFSNFRQSWQVLSLTRQKMPLLFSN